MCEKKIWMDELKAIYGELADTGIVHTTCGFELFKEGTHASEVQTTKEGATARCSGGASGAARAGT